MEQATITTLVGEVDVQQVNAWSVCDGADNRKIKGFFRSGAEVDIMSKKGDYVEIRGIGSKWDVNLQAELKEQKVRGWVHGSFLLK